jgi:hypothetical protein
LKLKINVTLNDRSRIRLCIYSVFVRVDKTSLIFVLSLLATGGDDVDNVNIVMFSLSYHFHTQPPAQ